MKITSLCRLSCLLVVSAIAIPVGIILANAGCRGSARLMTQAAPETVLSLSPPVLSLKVSPRSSPTSDIIASPSVSGDCPTIYGPDSGWAVELCATDPDIHTPMDVILDGVPQGQAALVRINHQSQDYPGNPQVAVIYASGFIRLKQNADPTLPIPFGSSFILGPAYWSDAATYHQNPQLTRLEIDTSWLPTGPLRTHAEGRNQGFDISYELVLPPPRDRQTRLHVTQIYTATTDVTVDATRRAESQGFKLVQISSMFISENGTCDGGHTDCHDSDGARFVGSDLARHQAVFSDTASSSFVYSPTLPLGSTWLDALHTDDHSWQGNTPNVRIALDALPGDHTVTPQGWISATINPDDDNIGLWLHDDGAASTSWTTGQSDRVSYWLLAQDNPPEPWADLGMRSGWTFLDFEGGHDCFFVKDAGQPTTGQVRTIASYSDAALELVYDLGGDDGNWAQIRCNFDPPLDLSAYDHLRFDWRGDPDAANSLEVGLINPGGSRERIFARGYHHASHHYWWGQLVIPFSFLYPWTDGTSFDLGQVSAFFISVVKDPVDDAGGAGSIAIDNLNAYNAISRTVPTSFSTSMTNTVASAAAAQWLASQQQGIGLLRSWAEESVCTAHTYDQALALIVFGHEGMWAQADDLVGALAEAQNDDGSWFKSYDCGKSDLPCVHCSKWEGDIAWAIYALSRYLALGGTHPQAGTTMDDGVAWLTTRLDTDGCLVIDHTEGTIDAWWALQAAGLDYRDEADQLKNCLLTYYWDDMMGRFKGGKDWWQPYLDNQTWGGAFLRAVCQEGDARRALSYAYEVLRLPAQGGQLFGSDGQGGPWSVWNEGTGQYVTVGGGGADDFVHELLAQQRSDGAMPGSPDDFAGGGVWTTRWHGVAPTAWLYFALNPDEPFPSRGCVRLPLILREHQ